MESRVVIIVVAAIAIIIGLLVDITSRRNDINHLQANLTSKRDENSHLQANLTFQRDENNRLQATLTSLREKNSHLQATISKLQNNLNRLIGIKNEELDKLREQINNLTVVMIKLNSTAENLQSELDDRNKCVNLCKSHESTGYCMQWMGEKIKGSFMAGVKLISELIYTITHLGTNTIPQIEYDTK